MIPPVVVDQQDGVGETRRRAVAPHQRPKRRVICLHPVGTAEGAVARQPMHSSPGADVQGHGFGVGEAPFHQVGAQVFCRLAQSRVEKRFVCAIHMTRQGQQQEVN